LRLGERISLSGDHLVPEHEGVVAYDNVVEIHGTVDQVWVYLSRWGLSQDGAAGLCLPSSVERWLPSKYQSLATQDEVSRTERLVPGNTVTDGPKGQKANILEHMDQGSGKPKTLLFESHWPGGWHYSYQFYAAQGSSADTTALLARTRWEGAKHLELTGKFAPVADRGFMKLLKSGLEERLDPAWGGGDGVTEAARPAGRAVSVAGAIGGAIAGRELVRHSPNKLLRAAAPLIGAAVGSTAARNVFAHKS
jgi:hypothetical protein